MDITRPNPSRSTDEIDAGTGIVWVVDRQVSLGWMVVHAQGLCVGSGVVEAGCKTAIGVRCKRAGMHWTVAGADAIIALRCCILSGRFEDFWERRSAAAVAGG